MKIINQEIVSSDLTLKLVKTFRVDAVNFQVIKAAIFLNTENIFL